METKAEMVQYTYKGFSKYVYINDEKSYDGNGDHYYYNDSVKDITLYKSNPIESELIGEIENILNTFVDYFETNTNTFIEKEETLLIF